MSTIEFAAQLRDLAAATVALPSGAKPSATEGLAFRQFRQNGRMPTRTSSQPGMPISELARRTGRSVHTIRWYEAQRLIPGVRRDAGGRRVFSELHVQWLELLARLRRSGMSIREMREYASLARRGEATLVQRRELLAEHRERVLQEIEELGAAVVLIDAKLVFYGEWIATGTRPGNELIDQAARTIAASPASRRSR